MSTKSIRKRASRHTRLSPPPQITLTERDKEIVKAVNDYRVMRQEHIEQLFFPSKNTAQKRLWLLWQNEFVKREFLPVLGGVQNSPILYLVDIPGVDLLQTEFGYEKSQLRFYPQSPGQQFLRHTLGLSDIRVAVTLSSQVYDYTIKTWIDETGMKADYDRVTVGRRMVSLIPDAYFAIWVPGGKQDFFVEFDRGPERLKAFATKIAAYTSYFKSPQCFNQYKTYAIRVLTIVEGTQARLEHLRRLAVNSDRQHHFWFATLDSVVKNDFLTAPIWHIAGETSPACLVEQS